LEGSKKVTLYKPDPKLPQHLHPISLLSTTGKLSEKVIQKIVQRHIDERNLLDASHSAAYHLLVLRMGEFNVFLKGHLLVYVISLALTNSINYNLHHVLPLPIQIRNTDLMDF
jgi:hypothetical protein